MIIQHQNTESFNYFKTDHLKYSQVRRIFDGREVDWQYLIEEIDDWYAIEDEHIVNELEDFFNKPSIEYFFGSDSNKFVDGIFVGTD